MEINMSALKEVGKEILQGFLDIFTSITMRGFMTKLIMIVAIFAAMFGGCSYFNKQFGLQDDNPIEEAIEDVIEHRTGIDVDLTP